MARGVNATSAQFEEDNLWLGMNPNLGLLKKSLLETILPWFLNPIQASPPSFLRQEPCPTRGLLLSYIQYTISSACCRAV